MLPMSSTLRPSASSTAAARAAVVLFPLVPGDGEHGRVGVVLEPDGQRRGHLPPRRPPPPPMLGPVPAHSGRAPPPRGPPSRRRPVGAPGYAPTQRRGHPSGRGVGGRRRSARGWVPGPAASTVRASPSAPIPHTASRRSRIRSRAAGATVHRRASPGGRPRRAARPRPTPRAVGEGQRRVGRQQGRHVVVVDQGGRMGGARAATTARSAPGGTAAQAGGKRRPTRDAPPRTRRACRRRS